MSFSITGLINNKEQVGTVFNGFGEPVFGREFAYLDAIVVK